MTKPIEFKAERQKATCLECNTTFQPTPDDRFEVSPHLREAHGFKGEVSFAITSEVICPFMQFITAKEAS